MKTLRIDHVTAVARDAAAAATTFGRLFGLAPAPATPGGAALAIGDARIEFVTPAAGTALGDALAAGGEGMAALTLTVADLDAAAAALGRAGIGFEAGTDAGGRALVVDPRAAHGVRLTLTERN